MRKRARISIPISCLIGLGLGLIYAAVAVNRLLPPNTHIAGVSVGLLPPLAAAQKIEQSLPPAPQATLTLSSPLATSSASLSELGLFPNTLAVIAQAQQPELNRLQRVWFAMKSTFRPQSYSITYAFAKDKIGEWVGRYAAEVDQPGIPASAELGRPGVLDTLAINRGEMSVVLDQDATVRAIEQNFNQQRLATHAVFAEENRPLTDAGYQTSLARASKFVGTELEFTNDQLQVPIIVSDQDLVSVLSLPEGINQPELEALVATIAATIDRPAVNPVFTYDPESLKVEQFAPPQVGLVLNQPAMIATMVNAIGTIESNTDSEEAAAKPMMFALQMAEAEPSVSLASTNDLGINEQIGFGNSHYDHSIPTRIKNVALATSRVNNVLVAPGKEFSFNKTLGEVSRATGFEPAYIIRNGATELGDGGGVCQVSTTLFRAVLNAGLDVTLRLPHSYRVSYYELDRKPGIDATVYAGNVDFRFINDTPNFILIHGEADSDELYMYYSIYGTSDGRYTEIKDHVTWGYAPPAPTQYIVDETLPPGAKKQIDWAAAGIKAKFTNVIYDKSGAVIREDTYTSNYKPWSAKYLVGPGTI